MKNVQDIYPLTPMQQGMLFHSVSAQATGQYVEQVVWTFAGRLNRAALVRAWEEAIARHPVLRTCFFWERLEEPRQVVRSRATLPWETWDWSGRRGPRLRTAFDSHVESDRRRGFALNQAPLVRITEIRLAPDEHRFIFTYHHLILDAWSVSLLLLEVFTSYEAFDRGETPSLPPRRPFHDYVAWLEQQPPGPAQEYWHTALPDAQRPLLHGGRAAGEDARYSTCERRLGDVAHLSSFVRTHSITLAALVQAAWALLVSRYTGGGDVIFGTVVSGRSAPLPGIEAMIGLFINTQPTRIRIDPRAPVRELLREVHAHQLFLRRFEHVSLKDIQKWSGRPAAPLFESIVVFDRRRQGSVPSVRELSHNHARTGYPLTLEALAAEDLLLKLTADERHTDRSTAARMLGQYVSLIERIAASPSAPVGELSLLTAPERQQILVEWNDRSVDAPCGRPLHRFIEDQAARTPGRIAVVDERARLTYRDVNGLANRLARYLNGLGIGPESRVGMCAERSCDMLWGLLAILKAGAAYVPIDPDYPAERRAFVLRDAQVGAVIAQDRLAPLLAGCPAPVVWLDADQDRWRGFPDTDPARDIATPHAAYAIYTSGSTGRPKAVLNTHRAIANRLLWMQREYTLTGEDAVLQKTPFSFDVSVWEFFWPLMAGARLVMARPGGHRDAGYLIDAIVDHRITVVHFVPSMLRVFLDAAGVDACRSLRHVFSSGEALAADLEQRFFERLDARLHNLYGPTEAAVDVTHWECRPARGRNSVPIGRPISNLRIYIVDPELQPAPIGAAGELCIAGEGLARGYWQRPDLTAEKFIPDPFATTAGGRLYKTGDLARYMPDGNIQYLGRDDDLVKVHGVRIELGEIEAVLREHSDVRDAAVALREECHIAAYVVPRPGVEPSTRRLRDFVAERLPIQMRPSAYAFLAALPLTPSGKVDRRALPLVTTAHRDAAEAIVPPRTEAEKLLAAIWSRVLGVSDVSAEDNFFERGGDSILALRVVWSAARSGLRISLLDVFQRVTLRELAAIAAAFARENAVEERAAGPVPLTPIQRWFFEQDRADPHHFNQSLVLELGRRVDPRNLADATGRVQARHDALRLRFERGGEGWRQIPATSTVPIPFSYVDLSGAPAPVRQAAFAQLQASLDVERGPLWRVVQVGADRLLLLAHHLVVDAVSWRIVIDDLLAIVTSGPRTPLALPTASYRQWAEALERYAQSAPVQAQRPFWIEQLADGPSSLPRDFTSGANLEASAQTVAVELSARTTESLRRGASLVEPVLLAALARACAEWTGASSLLVDLESHGRGPAADLPDVSRTAGWFTAIFPLTLRVPAGAPPAETLRHIVELRRSVPDNGLGYGALRYQSSTPLPPSRAELLFNYVGELDRDRSAPAGVRLSRERPVASRSPRARRSHLIEVNCAVVSGRLTVEWTYSDRIHRRETVERAVAAMVSHVDRLAADVKTAPFSQCSPSDFPLATLNDRVLTRLRTLCPDLEDVYPLSPMQQGMLFQSAQSVPDVYFQQWTIGVTGELSMPALERASQSLVDRHSVLRTSFHWRELDEPLQVVHRSAKVLVACEAGSREALPALLDDDRRRPFDLTVAPLLRVRVIALGEREHALVLSFHHLALDGWSAALVLKELFAAYGAAAGERELTAPISPGYRSYIAWLQRQTLADAERWWRAELSGLAAPTPLPLERPEAPARGRSVRELRLSAEFGERVNRAARRERITVSTIVQAAWALVLGRSSGSADVLFGSVVSGRPPDLEGSESMVGMLINTLPVRVRIPEDQPPAAFLETLHLHLAEVAQYLHVPLSKLRSWSQLPAGTPLFESIVIFENYPIAESAGDAAAGLEIHDVAVLEQSDYPLMLVVVPGREFTFRLLFDGRRFAGAAADRLLRQLQTAIAAMIAGGAACVGDIDVLPPAERHRVVIEANDTDHACPRDRCVHELFEERVAADPDRIALVHGAVCLSYCELNRRANQLARHLRRRGVGPDEVVGVCAERSIEMVVAFLGVLKAGAAWLPLDPAYPAERLAWMLADARAPVLLTRGEQGRRLAAVGRHVIALDADWTAIAGEDDRNPHNVATSDSLAYVIYTSGSTGVPKGVMIPHRSMVNHNLGCARPYGLRADDRLMQFGSISFDNSVEEIFPALLAGAAVVLRTDDMLASAREFLRAIDRERLSILNLPTAFWHAWVDELGEGGEQVPRSLRVMKVGGEEASAPHLARWREMAGERTAWLNGYGPTETAVTATFWKAGPTGPSRVPIGRPLGNVRVYVVDDSGRPVPIGVPGELYVGGAGMARGYRNLPGRTAERFVPDPFTAEPGARMYRTGDIARVLSSGDLEYLGRIDHQVKIRGYRVELGEIESALARHPAVREALVVTQSSPHGQRRLVAYAVSEVRSPAPLRDHLASILPDYMVPRTFVFLDRFPLSPNGKVDRARLPEPSASSEPAAAYVGPRDSIEALLASTWADVLGAPRVGIYDNFFELGGDSIVSLRIVARAAQHGLALSPRLLFEHPTVAELAPVVAVAGSDETWAAASTGAGAAFPETEISEREAERLAESLARMTTAPGGSRAAN